MEAAKAALRDAKLQLGYTQIHAPISGRIGRHLVDVGNLVQPEQTILGTIDSYDPLDVYFTMSESDLLFLNHRRAENNLPPLEEQGLVLEMGLGNEEGFPHEGRLDFGELGVDPNTGTIMYRATFPNADRLIVPGLFARLRTTIGEPQPKLLVPERALGTDQRGDYVLIVKEDGTVDYRPVQLGQTLAGQRVVNEGLKGDEWVVVNGVQRARPGAKVQPKRIEAVAAKPADATLSETSHHESSPVRGQLAHQG